MGHLRSASLLLVASFAVMMAEDPAPTPAPADATAQPGDIDPAAILAAARKADYFYQAHFHELVKQLNSPDEETRLKAITYASRLQDPQVVPLLLPHFDGDRSVAELTTTCYAIGRTGNPAGIPSLRRLLDTHPDRDVRIAAMDAMESLKAMRPDDYMGRTKDEDEDIAGIALTDLGTLAYDKAGDQLAAGLAHDHRGFIRRQCAIGLGRLGDKSRVNDLRDALGDADPMVRRFAAEALVKLQDLASTPFLLMALESEIDSVDMAHCLKLLTDQDFGFDVHGTNLERREAIDRGFKWWTDVGAKKL